jgi:hypothetical protein
VSADQASKDFAKCPPAVGTKAAFEIAGLQQAPPATLHTSYTIACVTDRGLAAGFVKGFG